VSKSGEPTVRGPWSVANAYEFLEHAVIPMRIGVESSSGCPLVLSLWFIADGYELLGPLNRTQCLPAALSEVHGVALKWRLMLPRIGVCGVRLRLSSNERRGRQTLTAYWSATSAQRLIH
jgi:hypothetical protein